MSAFDEATLLMETNPPQSCPWKQIGTKVVAAVDDSRSCEHLKKHVTDKYLTRFSTLLTFCYKKFMLLLQYLSDWFLHAVCLTEIPEEKHLILRDHLNQI